MVMSVLYYQYVGAGVSCMFVWLMHQLYQITAQLGTANICLHLTEASLRIHVLTGLVHLPHCCSSCCCSG